MKLAQIKKTDPERFKQLEKEYHLTHGTAFIEKYGGCRATFNRYFGKKKINFRGHFKRKKLKQTTSKKEQIEKRKEYDRLLISYNTVTNFYIKDVYKSKSESIIGYGKIEKHETTIFIYKDIEGFIKLNDGLSFAKFKAKDLLEVKKILKAYNVEKNIQVFLLRLG